MGFRTGSYATIWDVTPKTDQVTSVRLSISHKNKDTQEYEQDFSGFVSFIGTATALRAASLKKGDRIKLNDIDVSVVYNKETEQRYTNFKCFSFDVIPSNNSGKSRGSTSEAGLPDIDQNEFDEEDSIDGRKPPF